MLTVLTTETVLQVMTQQAYSLVDAGVVAQEKTPHKEFRPLIKNIFSNKYSRTGRYLKMPL